MNHNQDMEFITITTKRVWMAYAAHCCNRILRFAGDTVLDIEP